MQLSLRKAHMIETELLRISHGLPRVTETANMNHTSIELIESMGPSNQSSKMIEVATEKVKSAISIYNQKVSERLDETLALRAASAEIRNKIKLANNQELPGVEESKTIDGLIAEKLAHEQTISLLSQFAPEIPTEEVIAEGTESLVNTLFMSTRRLLQSGSQHSFNSPSDAKVGVTLIDIDTYTKYHEMYHEAKRKQAFCVDTLGWANSNLTISVSEETETLIRKHRLI